MRKKVLPACRAMSSQSHGRWHAAQRGDAMASSNQRRAHEKQHAMSQLTQWMRCVEDAHRSHRDIAVLL